MSGRSYARGFFTHEADAQAFFEALQEMRPRLRCGLIATTVASDAGPSVEWEVWLALPTMEPDTARYVASETEPDEHDRGRSTHWDEEHEQREWHD